MGVISSSVWSLHTRAKKICCYIPFVHKCKKKKVHTLICPLFSPKNMPGDGTKQRSGGWGSYRVPYASARTCRDAGKCLPPRTADVLDLPDLLLLRRMLRWITVCTELYHFSPLWAISGGQIPGSKCWAGGCVYLEFWHCFRGFQECLLPHAIATGWAIKLFILSVWWVKHLRVVLICISAVKCETGPFRCMLKHSFHFLFCS